MLGEPTTPVANRENVPRSAKAPPPAGFTLKTGASQIIKDHNPGAPAKNVVDKPPPRRPLMPLNSAISNLQPQGGGLLGGKLGASDFGKRFAWNEEMTTPGKGGAATAGSALPVLNGSNITVDSPDVLSKFHGEPGKPFPHSAAYQHGAPTGTSAATASAATAAAAAAHAAAAHAGAASPAYAPATPQDGLDFSPCTESSPLDIGPTYYERSFASEYNLQPRSAQSFLPTMTGHDLFIHSPDPVSKFNIQNVPSAMEQKLAASGRGAVVAQVRASIGEGEGIASAAWPSRARYAGGISSSVDSLFEDSPASSSSSSSSSSAAAAASAVARGGDEAASPMGATTATRRQLHGTLGTAGGMFSPVGTTGVDGDSLDKTISPYKPDYDVAVKKIRTLQSIVGADGEASMPALMSVDSSAVEHALDGRQSHQGMSRIPRPLVRRHSGSRVVEHTTSSVGVISTFLVDGSPVADGDGPGGRPTGKLCPIAPPSLPPTARASVDGPLPSSEAKETATFVKRGRVYRSLGAKEAFAFGSPPSEAKIVHLRKYSDTTATRAAAAAAVDTQSKEDKDGGADNDAKAAAAAAAAAAAQGAPRMRPRQPPRLPPGRQPDKAEAKDDTDCVVAGTGAKGCDERKSYRADKDVDEVDGNERYFPYGHEAHLSPGQSPQQGSSDEDSPTDTGDGTARRRQQLSPLGGSAPSGGSFYQTARDLMFSPPAHSHAHQHAHHRGAGHGGGAKASGPLYSPQDASPSPSPSPSSSAGRGHESKENGCDWVETDPDRAASPRRGRRLPLRPVRHVADNRSGGRGEDKDTPCDALLATIIGGPELSPVVVPKKHSRRRRGGGDDGAKEVSAGDGRRARKAPFTRVSRVAVSSNFGMSRAVRPAPRKKKKNSVNPFTASGPTLQCIPEDREVDFGTLCDL